MLANIIDDENILSLFGSDSDFQDYVRKQSSCISKEYNEYYLGEGYCCFCHVRRASNSGLSIKPKYSGVPMTHIEHMAQHALAESHYGGKQFFDNAVIYYRKEWLKYRIGRSHNVLIANDDELEAFVIQLLNSVKECSNG